MSLLVDCKRQQQYFDLSSTYVHSASIHCLLPMSHSSWPYDDKDLKKAVSVFRRKRQTDNSVQLVQYHMPGM